jgi:hypothetical protein
MPVFGVLEGELGALEMFGVLGVLGMLGVLEVLVSGDAGLVRGAGAGAARSPAAPLAHAVAATPAAPRTATAAKVCERAGNRDNSGRIIGQSFTVLPPAPKPHWSPHRGESGHHNV